MPGTGLPVVMSSTMCANEVGYAGSGRADDSVVATAAVSVEDSFACSGTAVAGFDSDDSPANQAL